MEKINFDHTQDHLAKCVFSQLSLAAKEEAKMDYSDKLTDIDAKITELVKDASEDKRNVSDSEVLEIIYNNSRDVRDVLILAYSIGIKAGIGASQSGNFKAVKIKK
jgi:hypothetical protein